MIVLVLVETLCSGLRVVGRFAAAALFSYVFGLVNGRPVQY